METTTQTKSCAKATTNCRARATQSLAALTAAIFACGAAESCVNIEYDEPENGNAQQIVYNLFPVKTGTKAATFEAFPTSATFGSVARLLPDGKNWIDNSEESTPYIGGASTGTGTGTGTGSTGTGTGTGTTTGTTAIGEEISYQNGVWKAWKSGSVYWWPRTGTLSFFSWSPYDLVEKGLSFNAVDGLRIDGWNMKNKVGYGSTATDGCVDILTARNLDCTRGGTNGVSTIFKHALCKVSVVISLDYEPTDGKKWTVEKVELKDIYTTGNFVSTTWNNYSNVQNYVNEFSTAVEVKMGENSVILPPTMMIPQPLMRSSDGSRIPRIEIACYDGVSGHYETGVWVKDKTTFTGVLYSNTSELVRWKEGSNYTYHLYLTDKSENYIEFDATTDDWSYSDAGDIELK